MLSGSPSRYVFMSSPSMGNVYYSLLPSFHDLTVQAAKRPVREAKVLIDGKESKCTGWGCTEDADKGLKEPRALALFQQEPGSGTLYVSDKQAACIYAYQLWMSDIQLSVGEQKRVVENTHAAVNSMTTDSYGNLFFTTEDDTVQWLNASDLRKEGVKTPAVLYTGNDASVAGVSGIAADNFFLYWANQQGDTNSGIVARAPERPRNGSTTPPKVLAANSDLYQNVALNVCLARDNLFFTGESEYLFAVKNSGGLIANISRSFTAPQGCAYDGESTLYVADAGSNAIFSLPGNMDALRPIRHVAKVVSVQEPDQIAIFFAQEGGIVEHVKHHVGAAPARPPAGLAVVLSLAVAASCS